MSTTVRELFRYSPEEAQSAYEKVRRFTREDLERILGEYNDLSDGNQGRFEFSMALFDYLDREIS